MESENECKLIHKTWNCSYASLLFAFIMIWMIALITIRITIWCCWNTMPLFRLRIIFTLFWCNSFCSDTDKWLRSARMLFCWWKVFLYSSSFKKLCCINRLVDNGMSKRIKMNAKLMCSSGVWLAANKTCVRSFIITYESESRDTLLNFLFFCPKLFTLRSTLLSLLIGICCIICRSLLFRVMLKMKVDVNEFVQKRMLFFNRRKVINNKWNKTA